jgi:4-hydroxy-tetrahydrodipicolinate synthase
MSNDFLFSGVIAPVCTPYDAALNPDAGKFVRHAKWLLADGCTGLAPFGTTGEALSLGLDERRTLLEALVEGGVDPTILMPGTGLCSIPDTVALTRHAVELGCGGAMVLPPFYFKGVSDEGLFAHFAEVIERVNDDRLRIYLYHIPPQAVIGFSIELVGRLIEAFPGVVVGLKDSSGEWPYTRDLLAAFPGFRALSGSEVFLLDNLRHGGAGCITATGNVNARRIRGVYDNWQADNADALQAEITNMRKTVQSKPMIPMLKRIIAHYSGDESWAPVRPPHLNLSESLAREVIDELEKDYGFSLDLSALDGAREVA